MVGDILQPTHLLFILVVALLVLGPKRLPEVGRTLGSGLRDFRQAINGESNHDDDEPRAYVETEPDIDTGPAFAEEEPAAVAVEDHPAEHDVADESSRTPDPETDAGPAFATGHADVEPDTETGAMSDEDAAPEPVPAAESTPQQTATAPSSAFASALAETRRQTGDDTADDE